MTVGESRYRLTTNDTSFLATFGECASDEPGITHMIVVASSAELDAVRTGLCAGGGCAQAWIGHYASDGTNFATITGEVGCQRWESGQPGDVDQAPVVVESYLPTGVMTDVYIQSGGEYATICECDGRSATQPALRVPPMGH